SHPKTFHLSSRQVRISIVSVALAVSYIYWLYCMTADVICYALSWCPDFPPRKNPKYMSSPQRPKISLMIY
ncbi:MAG: hypothetical protein PHF26_03970, partial [Candidatus Gracilibacteria bacterium]|nr:hypothetical protein [Candidatus Gracilibacteria bacterium]